MVKPKIYKKLIRIERNQRKNETKIKTEIKRQSNRELNENENEIGERVGRILNMNEWMTRKRVSDE